MVLCFFGDSIGKGVVYDSARARYVSCSASFVKLTEQEEACHVENFSRYGCTVTRGRELVKKNTGRIEEADGVLLEFGGNDSDFDWQRISDNPDAAHVPHTPLSLFVDTYKGTIEEIRKLGKRPVLLNLPPIDEKKYFRWISRGLSAENILKWLGGDAIYIYRWHEMYNAAVCDICNATGTPMIDIRSAFLIRKDYSDYLCEDGIHPNEKGHLLIREAMKPAMAGIAAPRQV